MTHIETDQGCLSNCATTHQHLVDRVAEQRSIRSQIGTDGDSPDSDLVPWEQIASEAQKQSYKEEHHSNYPVELSRWLISSMIEDADHMQRHGNYHQVSRPTVHIAY